MLAARSCRIVLVAQPLRDAELEERPRSALGLPLLLEHALHLSARELNRGERVRERLHGRSLAVGHGAVGIALTGGCEREVRPDAARVHECDVGVRRPEVRVGDKVADGGFAAAVLARAVALASAVEIGRD